MTDRNRRILLSSAAAVHLLLVLAGGLDLCLWEFGLPGRVLAGYSIASGAAAGYSYYAPSVGSPSRATFTVTDADGHALVDTLPQHLTREADIRFEHLVGLIHDPDVDRTQRDALTRSWAAAMFARHPGATRVSIDLGRDRVPSMTDLRRGARIRWRSALRARIARIPAPDRSPP